ncbi:unnamed protein product, partial [Fusarium fujikuroi]
WQCQLRRGLRQIDQSPEKWPTSHNKGEYLADNIPTQLGNSAIQHRETNPFNRYPEAWEFDRSKAATDFATRTGQPQLLPCGFSNTPLQTSYIGGNPHNNYGAGYGYDIQQPLVPPTVFATQACIFPINLSPGILQQYPAIHQEDVRMNQQNHQALIEPSLKLETISYPQSPPEPGLICFGMIKGLSARCRPSVNHSLSEFSVKILDAENFIGSDDASIEGKVSHEFTHLTSALFGQSELVLEINCSTLDNPSKPGPQMPGKRIPGYSSQCTLDIIIYGPPDLSQDVGSFFEEYELYLQDPINCKQNVRYCNPHRLSVNPSDVKYTFDLGKSTVQLASTIDINDDPELLDIIFSHQDLAEAAQPRSIRTPLQPHQKQALTFLLQREFGWAWDGCRTDIWEIRDYGNESYFYNTVSGAVQVEQPPQFYGGIVADPMGLGKTLSMIALVACDVRAEDIEPSSLPGVDIEVSSGKTLIIVPAPLMGSWEEQLQRHCFPNSLPWRCHHNQSRLRVASDLDQVAIVLTTYHTVMTEWKKGKETDQSIIFSTKWKRVILDEGTSYSDTHFVVFSSWRTTLNVIQASLDHESIPCLRFDGTITQKERHNVIERFRNEPQIRVLLLTLTCGAAYIDGSFPSLFDGAKLESNTGRPGAGTNSPDWANSRSDYIEDVCAKLLRGEAQASKRDLARILLNPANGDENRTESGLNRLEFLRRLV